jgi:hypothetical protein
VINGILWVSEPVGTGHLNYCADPVTGQLRARLPLLHGNSTFLTADATSIYYADVPLRGAPAALNSAPINRRCTS